MSDGPAFLDETVPELLDGERIDRTLSTLVPCSRSEAADALAAGHVRVDGQVVTKASHRVAAGDHLVLAVDPVRHEQPVVADGTVELTVLHADDDIVVVDKPPGLVVHPGPGHKGATLVHGLLARFPDLDPANGTPVGEPERPGLVHRLDRGTSGLLVVARTPQAYDSLVEQLSTHSVERTYTALVRGRPEHRHGVIDAPIGRSRRDPLRMTVAADGRPARTHYRLEHQFHSSTEDGGRDRPTEVALVTCDLETGRTHQIRVHLTSIGHPVVGDPLYGGPARRPHVGRPFLHARRLSFLHPGSGDEVSFESPLPADLAAVLDTLRPELDEAGRAAAGV
jgi:23S rRNA pseudouridine1911/1915/1917 synthase